MPYDIIIIGSGPAGYVAAIRAGQVGMKVAIIEKNEIGGMCLNWGCIPSKSMIESAIFYRKIQNDALKFGIEGINKKEIKFNYEKALRRANSIVKRLTKGVEFLLKKNNVEIIIGEAELISENTISVNNRTLEAKNIVLATGTYFDDLSESDKAVNIKDFFSLKEIPQNIIIYGFDAPSVEIAQMLAMVDKSVTLVANKALLPLADNYLSDFVKKLFKKEKIRIIEGDDFDNLKIEKDNIIVGENTIPYDMIINISNRKAVLPKTKLPIELENGFVKTDSNLQTSIPGLYAIGDINGKSRFAHIASAEGLFLINHLNGVKDKLVFEKYPLNMYTHPEMAQIGKTEQQIQEEKIAYKVSEFSLNANGKALAEGNNEGVIRILSEKKYGEVLGVQIIAEHATDMISEASAFLQLESTVYDIAKTVHAHPTVSEAFMEAGMEGVDKAIHK